MTSSNDRTDRTDARRPPNIGPGRRAWWYFLRFFCVVWMKLCYRIRVQGRHHVPRRGAVLFVSNHQSFLDPIIVGIGTRLPFFALARSTLFHRPLMGWLIRSLSAIPVEQGAGDLSAMRQCVQVLKADQPLLIFPEGARTLDGRTHPFETGTMLLIKRARPRVVPVAIEGAFEVWPRGAKRPKPFGRIAVAFAEPIEAETLVAMGAEEARTHLADLVESMRLGLRGDGATADAASASPDAVGR